MHNQNVNNVRQYIRESAVVDLEQISTKLTATTDPTGSRKMFELERALAQLPLEQRQVILLVGLEGMSYQDTAGILTIPIGTVRSRLSRGRDVLRRLLDLDAGFWIWMNPVFRQLLCPRQPEARPAVLGEWIYFTNCRPESTR
jgi:RNA polymerase sigma-70 factor (ECF subfamily)